MSPVITESGTVEIPAFVGWRTCRYPKADRGFLSSGKEVTRVVKSNKRFNFMIDFGLMKG
jgi:hypothetical protein